MSVSSPSGGSKPKARSLSRKEAMGKFRALAEAYRILGQALLEEKPVSDARRAELLSIMAIVKGIDDGS